MAYGPGVNEINYADLPPTGDTVNSAFQKTQNQLDTLYTGLNNDIVRASEADVNTATDTTKLITPGTLLKGKVNGVASLDALGKVTNTELPLASETVKGVVGTSHVSRGFSGGGYREGGNTCGLQSGFSLHHPCYYSRSAPFAPTKTTIVTPPVRLWVNIALDGYIKEASETLDLNDEASWDSISPDYRVASARAGKDFYLYACAQLDGTFKYLLSANSTVPTGYTADNSRKIGGFHCLCVSVGTISGHTLSGYVEGDILPASVWDLTHRPASEPEGMVYVSGLTFGLTFISHLFLMANLSQPMVVLLRMVQVQPSFMGIALTSTLG